MSIDVVEDLLREEGNRIYKPRLADGENSFSAEMEGRITDGAITRWNGFRDYIDRFDISQVTIANGERVIVFGNLHDSEIINHIKKSLVEFCERKRIRR